MKKNKKKLYRHKKKRNLNKIIGTKNNPRLSLFRSNKQIYAQLIDDFSGHTLLCFSTLEILETIKVYYSTFKKYKSYFVGRVIANLLIESNLKKITFNRGNKSYKGLIKALIEGVINVNL